MACHFRKLPLVRLTAKGRRWQRTGHPWIYRDDLAEDPALPAGELVAVLDHHDTFLGQAFYSAASRIALRFVTYGEEEVNASFWGDRAREALAWRRKVAPASNAIRLIHGEADGFPGLVVDSYAGHLAVQTLHPGMERHLPVIIDVLRRLVEPNSITLRHDAEVRRLEKLPLEVKTIWGELPERVEVWEGQVKFAVDVRGGQKTGLFLDQRDNRLAAVRWSEGAVLDAFAYQGGFAMHLAPKAEQVTLVDSSGLALAQARENARLNGLTNLEFVQDNVFTFLKKAVQEGRRYEVIVLDPPAFAKSRAERPGALKGYREINRRAFQLLKPGGLLITSSCSYNISEREFLEVVRQAALEARRTARLVARRGASLDHPVLLSLPESLYLKCFFLAVA